MSAAGTDGLGASHAPTTNCRVASPGYCWVCEALCVIHGGSRPGDHAVGLRGLRTGFLESPHLPFHCSEPGCPPPSPTFSCPYPFASVGCQPAVPVQHFEFCAQSSDFSMEWEKDGLMFPYKEKGGPCLPRACGEQEEKALGPGACTSPGTLIQPWTLVTACSPWVPVLLPSGQKSEIRCLLGRVPSAPARKRVVRPFPSLLLVCCALWGALARNSVTPASVFVFT